MIINEAVLDKVAKQMIEAIHDVACRYGYNKLQASRISFKPESNNSLNLKLNHDDTSLFINNLLGLSRATHEQFGDVLLKWEVRAVNKTEHSKTLQLQDCNTLAHECQVLRQLTDSACSVPLLKYITEAIALVGSHHYLTIAVLPYYPLGSLNHYLKTHKLPNSQKITLLLAAANAISDLHAAGWIHGDIKPSNFLIAKTASEFNLKLSDFALAIPIEERSSISRGDNRGLILPRGTPAYLAPECWQGQGISIQSDIYAFGVMLVEILTGERPYQIQRNDEESQDSITSKWAQAHCQAPIPKSPLEWRGLQPLVERALAKSLDVRADRMSVLIDELSRLNLL